MLVYKEFEDYYDNGMVKLKDRIEDEFWYHDYQTIMKLITFNEFKSLGEFINTSRKEILSYRKIPLKMDYSIHLWCVLHWERKKHMPNFIEEYKKKYIIHPISKEKIYEYIPPLIENKKETILPNLVIISGLFPKIKDRIKRKL